MGKGDLKTDCNNNVIITYLQKHSDLPLFTSHLPYSHTHTQTHATSFSFASVRPEKGQPGKWWFHPWRGGGSLSGKGSPWAHQPCLWGWNQDILSVAALIPHYKPDLHMPPKPLLKSVSWAPCCVYSTVDKATFVLPQYRAQLGPAS
jgi:hypothetical protein